MIGDSQVMMFANYSKDSFCPAFNFLILSLINQNYLSMRTLLFSFIMFPLLVCAQPNYRLYDFNIKTGEGENYYEREAKRNFEPGTGAMEDANVPDRFQTSMGLINAATGLKIAKRKGSISDLQELLRANFDWITQSNLSAIEDLESQSATFVDDETVNQKAELVNYYTVLDKYNRALRSMPP
ncbi:MAG: hypothetical protein ACI8QD_002587, partial [Cyclobacteriaceae bacterium]